MSCVLLFSLSFQRDKNTKRAANRQQLSMCAKIVCVPQTKKHFVFLLLHETTKRLQQKKLPHDGAQSLKLHCFLRSLLCVVLSFCSSCQNFALVSKNVLFCVARNSTQFWSNKAIPKCPRSDSCVLRILLAVLQKQFSDSSNGGQSTHKLRTDRRKREAILSVFDDKKKNKQQQQVLLFLTLAREEEKCSLLFCRIKNQILILFLQTHLCKQLRSG